MKRKGKGPKKKRTPKSRWDRPNLLRRRMGGGDSARATLMLFSSRPKISREKRMEGNRFPPNKKHKKKSGRWPNEQKEN